MGNQWTSELRGADASISARELGLKRFDGFSFAGNRLYLAVGREQGGARIRAYDISLEPPQELSQNWQGLASFHEVVDVCVLQIKQNWLAWISAGKGGTDFAIYQFYSTDGLTWLLDGVPLGENCGYHNNPSVVDDGAGGWRMYFRQGMTPALGNVIASAVSSEGRNWKIETGERIRPGGLWDTHGVAFPFVRRDGGRYTMYYTGYWGDCAEGHAAARYWESQV